MYTDDNKTLKTKQEMPKKRKEKKKKYTREGKDAIQVVFNVPMSIMSIFNVSLSRETSPHYFKWYPYSCFSAANNIIQVREKKEMILRRVTWWHGFH